MLKNKVILVTGSSSGIGKNIIETVAKYEAIPIITFYPKDKKQKRDAEELSKKIGTNFFLPLDITNLKSINSCFKKIITKYKKLDVLVNNAGINIVNDFDKVTDTEWNKVINTNLKGTFLCMREVYKYITTKGKIINIGSVSGQYGGPRTTSYACSKAGIMALTHCGARFFGPKKEVSVNCVSPGPINTGMISFMSKKIVRETKENLLLKRFGEVKEVSELVAFLSSDKSSFITAQTIGINGGVWV